MTLLQLLRAMLSGGSPPPPVLPQITPVAAPIDPGGVLGCGQPRAEIWTRGLVDRVLELPSINAVEWGRVLADTSLGMVELDGQAVTADPACCAVLRGVRPWTHELVIYRDDALGWSGPITEIVMEADVLTFKARDLSAWLDHRFVHETHIYGGQGVAEGDTDTTTIFTDLVTDAMAPDTSPNLALSFGLVSGVLSQGNYTPASFKTVGPLIRDLAKGSIDWYVIDRTLFYTGGGASASGGTGGGTPPPGAIDVTATTFSNPGFEVNTTGWAQTQPGGATINRDTVIFQAGVASGRVDYGTVARSKLTFTVSGLISGKSYTLAGWFRHTSPPPSGSVSNTMNIAGVTSVDFGYVIQRSAPVTWFQASVTFTATAGSHLLTINDQTISVLGMHFWVDNFTVTLNNPDAPPPPPPPPPPPATPTVAPSLLHLNDDDLQVPARITLSGLNQETRSVVTGQQAGGDVAFYGEAPAPQWALNTTGPGLTTEQSLYGLLETPTTSTLTDANTAQSQATQRSGLLTDTPIILENFVLNRTANVTAPQLVPGTLIVVQLDRPCLSVQQTMLLRQVTFKATPDGEAVTLALEPTATEGV